jgi:sugar phosphate permease
MAETVSAMAVDGRALYAKISWRLIPYVFLPYIAAYLDRVNVGFAPMDTAAAGGVAIITMLGAAGGFLGPYVTGRMRDATDSFASGLYLIGG